LYDERYCGVQEQRNENDESINSNKKKVRREECRLAVEEKNIERRATIILYLFFDDRGGSLLDHLTHK
jgi:hypothetical protein